MGAVQRLNQFIELKGISKYKFYQKTGLSNGALDKGDNIGSDKCEKIHSAFPEINLVWLLTGQGEMLIDSLASTPAYSSTEKFTEATVYYNMYKEKDAEVKTQAEEIGALKHTVQMLEEKLLGLRQSSTPFQEDSTGSPRTRKRGVVESESAQFAEQE